MPPAPLRKLPVPHDSSPGPLRLGVSACLLGHKVRYDGQHKRDRFLVDDLGRHVEWVPVCPEVESGMPIPRPTVRLERHGSRLRMISDKGVDYTESMERLAERRVRALADEGLCGYVLKANSPSCGMERVKIYPGPGKTMPSKDGRGLFAAALMVVFPDLPVEEEGRLNDARLRENFIERIFAYQRLQRLFSARWRLGDVVGFHTAHKLSLLAHEPAGYQALGRLVARAKDLPRATFRGHYQRRFMAAMAHMATPGRHTNVLLHMTGYLRRMLPDRERAELASLIEDYRRGLLPLIVPITLLRHHVERLEVSYLAGQSYLQPHPKELMLRNRV